MMIASIRINGYYLGGAVAKQTLKLLLSNANINFGDDGCV